MFLMLLGHRASAGGGADASSDNWRRTAQGWERLDDWRRKPPGGYDYFVADDPRSAAATRWDIHPAAAVLLQGAAIALAFALLDRPGARSRRTVRVDSGSENSVIDQGVHSQAA
jgi:hypothetical protein